MDARDDGWGGRKKGRKEGKDVRKQYQERKKKGGGVKKEGWKQGRKDGYGWTGGDGRKGENEGLLGWKEGKEI